MQKTEFIQQVAQEAGVPKSQADKVVRATLKVIQDALSKGDKVSLIGFGSFQVRDRGERSVTSIRTKEKVSVPASKLPVFSAGSELKAAVSGKGSSQAGGSANGTSSAAGASGAGAGKSSAGKASGGKAGSGKSGAR